MENRRTNVLLAKENRKVEEPCSFETRVETPVYGGFALGREGKIIFIKGAIPGELVEIKIKETRKDYSVGEVTRVIEPSESRRTPPCQYFGACGGCQLQFIEYDRQVAIKKEILGESLKRIGGIEIKDLTTLTGNEFFYRHRAQFKVSQDGQVGFFKEGTRQVISIENCLICIPPINNLLLKLKGIDLGGIKELHVISGDTISILIKGSVKEDTLQAILDAGVSGIAFENGDSIGKDFITLEYKDFRYTVTPWGFFQGNWELNKKLVNMILERLSPLEGKKVLDLYSGAGNFSIPIAKMASEVVSIEENPYAVEDGKRNLMINGIKNCLFIKASVEEIFKNRKRWKIIDERRYDIIILNPPRPGLSSEICKGILDIGSERIVYVSCNPTTLARDLKRLKDRYEIESLSLVDLFPNTYHIETVVFMRSK